MLVSALVALLVGAVSAAWLARAAAGRLLLDLPNERSLHVSPTPRTGGLAVMLALVTGMAAAVLTGAIDLDIAEHRTVVLAIVLAVSLGVLSVADDRWGLPVSVRFLAHVAAATIFVIEGDYVHAVSLPVLGSIDLGPFGMPLTVLGIVWMVNLYNFMDGLDGLAGGMTVIGFSAVALVSALAGRTPLLILGLLTAGAAAGFLRQNLPKARMFLGDCGSVPVGFLAGAVTAMFGAAEHQLWMALIVFAPFSADATITLARRLRRGESLWKAHRHHYYQRLVLSGWTVRRVLACEYAVMCGAAVLAAAYVVAAPWGRAVIVVVAAIAVAALAHAADAVTNRTTPELSTMPT